MWLRKTSKMLYLPHKPSSPLTLPSSPNCFHGMLSGFGHNLLDLSLIIQHEIRKKKMVKQFWPILPPIFGFLAYFEVGSETPAGSEILSLLRISQFFSVYLADFLSHLGKWAKLIKFVDKNECFCTWKVEKPKCTTSTP